MTRSIDSAVRFAEAYCDAPERKSILRNKKEIAQWVSRYSHLDILGFYGIGETKASEIKWFVEGYGFRLSTVSRTMSGISRGRFLLRKRISGR